MNIEKLAIAFPVHGDMKVETAFALTEAVRTLPWPTGLAAEPGPYVHRNRERLCETAIEDGYSHLLFIDTDVMFPINGIQRLAVHDVDLVGAMYNKKYKPKPPGLEVPRTTTVLLFDKKLKTLPTLTEKFKCDAIPTGFMLIRLSCLKDIPRPWFDVEMLPTFIGEDVYFCRKLRDHGIDVWCDPTIPVAHIGDFYY